MEARDFVVPAGFEPTILFPKVFPNFISKETKSPLTLRKKRTQSDLVFQRSLKVDFGCRIVRHL